MLRIFLEPCVGWVIVLDFRSKGRGFESDCGFFRYNFLFAHYHVLKIVRKPFNINVSDDGLVTCQEWNATTEKWMGICQMYFFNVLLTSPLEIFKDLSAWRSEKISTKLRDNKQSWHYFPFFYTSKRFFQISGLQRLHCHINLCMWVK